jgi:hypothetical protein
MVHRPSWSGEVRKDILVITQDTGHYHLLDFQVNNASWSSADDGERSVPLLIIAALETITLPLSGGENANG